MNNTKKTGKKQKRCSAGHKQWWKGSKNCSKNTKSPHWANGGTASGGNPNRRRDEYGRFLPDPK